MADEKTATPEVDALQARAHALTLGEELAAIWHLARRLERERDDWKYATGSAIKVRDEMERLCEERLRERDALRAELAHSKAIAQGLQADWERSIRERDESRDAYRALKAIHDAALNRCGELERERDKAQSKLSRVLALIGKYLDDEAEAIQGLKMLLRIEMEEQKNDAR